MIKKFVFSSEKEKSALLGFTLAEILITLTIIGIVAAITIPSLMANVQEKAWEAQTKAFQARMSQTFPQLSRLNGYGINTDGTVDVDNAAQIFITEGLSKVYKIASICSSDKIASCGFPSAITTSDGEKSISTPKDITALNPLMTSVHETLKDDHRANTEANGGIIQNTKAAAFETLNGESVLVFYNPNCTPVHEINWGYLQQFVCVNLVFDVNGEKAPNQMGKDIGVVTAFGSTDSIVGAPIPVNNDSSSENANKYGSIEIDDATNICKTQDSSSRLPERYELASLFVNAPLFNMRQDRDYGTGNVFFNKNGVKLSTRIGFMEGAIFYDKLPIFVRCVKK